jgi:hypothetical protein
MRIFLLVRLAFIFALVTACSPSEEQVFGTVIDVPIPTTGNVTGPRFSQGADSSLVLSWMESLESETALKYSVLDNGSFSTPRNVVTEPRMFVNWADLPSVMKVNADHLIAHWLRYSADAVYSYDVVVSQSADAGITWSEGITAHSDGTPTEHGFVSMHQEADGIALLWLDGRNTANEPGENVLDTSMTLRSAVLTSDGRVTRKQLIDESVCDCCQTDVAISSKGPLAVYRDRTVDEIRDIYISRSVDGQWQPGRRIYADNWTIAGCPVNGPSIVANGDFVAIAWFSAANNRPVVRVVISDDGGTTFANPVEVASGRLAGYVGLALLDDDNLVTSWVSRNASGNNALNLRRLSNRLQLEPVQEIAEISQLRVFPQIAVRNNNLFVAWTNDTDGSRQLRLVRIPVAAN